MDKFRQRRSSFSPFGSGKQEPLIVVEESGATEEDDQSSSGTPTYRASLDIDSPVNPYLLSPWRDPRESRKHSLPSQQVTEGITASQVRRLSERGGEGSGPSPNEAAFLATLSQSKAPSGRRHSVVTISKIPAAIFGRSRRESVAAFPLPTAGRVLSSRRESSASTGPPSTDPIGSIHNLQLDIMDDIVQSRKARLKLWTTSNEKVCEVETVNETGASTQQRYTNRRYSEVIPAGVSPTPAFRRASEHPAIISPCLLPNSRTPSQRKKKSPGVGFLGSRTDLSTIFSNLTSSAIEIHKCDESPSFSKTKASPGGSSNHSTTSNTLDPNVGRSTRSNSFDVSLLQNAKQLVSDAEDKGAALSGWFTNRHQPMARKKSIRKKSTAMAMSKDVLERLQNKDILKEKPKPKPKSKWDSKGGMMDPTVIGSAIEGFLRRSTGTTSSSSSKGAVPKDRGARSRIPSTARATMNWFSRTEEDDSKDTCDTSLCSTLKDLFVK
ncbi:uncharacterized protein LOC129946720 [Eupeodes corollae]|uniref:uncharacterized protein LOC129946720 n=1 Tax=Eupeodes corollae TaxID=290404 RepID=UPI002492B0BA|nr:uncharacterized protein LOC129946720 [Eupeodes corollae]